MSELSRYTALTLRAGIAVGLILMIAGLIIGDGLLEAGLLILIASPLLGVFVTTACLIREKDRIWTCVAVALIAIVILGIVVSLLR